jgi:hypothetical protein
LFLQIYGHLGEALAQFFSQLIKRKIMKTSRPPSFVAAVLFVAALLAGASFLPSCGHSDSGAVKSDTTRSVTAPGPDVNSANNPSSADTMYQRDSTRRTRDTAK